MYSETIFRILISRCSKKFVVSLVCSDDDDDDSLFDNDDDDDDDDDDGGGDGGEFKIISRW